MESFARDQPGYTPAAFAATAISPEEVKIRMEQGPVRVILFYYIFSTVYPAGLRAGYRVE